MEEIDVTSARTTKLSIVIAAATGGAIASKATPIISDSTVVQNMKTTIMTQELMSQEFAGFENLNNSKAIDGSLGIIIGIFAACVANKLAANLMGDKVIRRSIAQKKP